MPASSQARNSRAPSPFGFLDQINRYPALRDRGQSSPLSFSQSASSFSQHQQGGGFSQSFFLVAQLALKFLDLFLISQALFTKHLFPLGTALEALQRLFFPTPDLFGVKPFPGNTG